MKKTPAKMAKKSPAKMMKKSPAKKALKGKQGSLPKELKDAILASPGKMLKPSAMKMMKKSPAKMVKKSSTKVNNMKNKTAEEKAHNKAARKTEGSRLRQGARRLVNRIKKKK